MKFYEITYMIEDEQHKRLSALAEHYNEIKGWDEKELLQYAVTATVKSDIETKLQFLENQIVQLEKECHGYKEGKNNLHSYKKVYISDAERIKCRKVVNAYTEELDNDEVIVIEAGRYGFVKLAYYQLPYGFDRTVAHTNSLELFLDLWNEWLESQLLRLTEDTPLAEMDYEDMFKCLSKDKQEELMEKREYFAKKAEIHLE